METMDADGEGAMIHPYFNPACNWTVRHVPFARHVIVFLRNIWHSMCDRLAEWILTGWTINFGLTLFQQGDTFATPSYEILAQWAPEETWAAFCIIGGGCRLALLIINGAWRKSPHFRVGAAIGTIPMWVAISYGFHEAGTISTGTGAYAICVYAEMVSIHRALKEAGHNDGKGPHQRNIG